MSDRGKEGGRRVSEERHFETRNSQISLKFHINIYNFIDIFRGLGLDLRLVNPVKAWLHY